MDTVNERMTGEIEGDVVVFLIGMRINTWWKVHRWAPVAAAMPRMIRELELHPELGFLGAEAWFGRTTLMLQYWRSMDQLMAYAKKRDSAHLPAWGDFNRRIGTSGDVGIFHETYRVRPGDRETVYVNMPRFGMGKVGTLVPARGRRHHAEERLRVEVSAS